MLLVLIVKKIKQFIDILSVSAVVANRWEFSITLAVIAINLNNSSVSDRFFYAVVRILDLWLGFNWTKSEFWLGKSGISLRTQTSKFNMAAALMAAGVSCSSDGLCSTPSILSLGLSLVLLLSKFSDLTLIGPNKKNLELGLGLSQSGLFELDLVRKWEPIIDPATNVFPTANDKQRLGNKQLTKNGPVSWLIKKKQRRHLNI